MAELKSDPDSRTSESMLLTINLCQVEQVQYHATTIPRSPDRRVYHSLEILLYGSISTGPGKDFEELMISRYVFKLLETPLYLPSLNVGGLLQLYHDSM